MKKLFYVIKIEDNPDVVKKLEKSLTREQIERASEIDIDVFDTIQGGFIHSYVYADIFSIREMCSFMVDLGMTIDAKDISEEILYQTIKFDNGEFEYMKNEFIKENLTSDMILDKINDLGMDSLTDIDRSVLEGIS